MRGFTIVSWSASSDRRDVVTTRPAILMFLMKRTLLSLITLGILSIVVFSAVSCCPATWGGRCSARWPTPERSRLQSSGRRRPAAAGPVLGLDHALPGRATWADPSPSARRSRRSSRDALLNSLKLAALAFLLVVPLGIAAGCGRRCTWGPGPIAVWCCSASRSAWCRSSSPRSCSSSSSACWLHWLPMSADWPEGAGPLTQFGT